MVTLVALGVLASQADPTDPMTQWTALGILALVLIAVGKAGWSLVDRADKRVEAIRLEAEATRKKEREEDLANSERLAAALLEAAQVSHRMIETMGRMEAGYREHTTALERLEARLR